MFNRSSNGSSSFCREPGDWKCSKCPEINFRSRDSCRRCATPRAQTVSNNPNPINTTSQYVARQNDWTCYFCNCMNFAVHSACYKCNRGKQETMDADAFAVVVVPGDWKCSSCLEMNFGSRVVCRSCSTARPSTETSSCDNKSECVICMKRAIDSVITTCGHSAVCLQCGKQVGQCPICRHPFAQQQIIKLYNVHS